MVIINGKFEEPKILNEIVMNEITAITKIIDSLYASANSTNWSGWTKIVE